MSWPAETGVIPTPIHWTARSNGYSFTVRLQVVWSETNIWEWCTAMFGPISDGRWIDHSRTTLCFQTLEDAQLFYLTWGES